MLQSVTFTTIDKSSFDDSLKKALRDAAFSADILDLCLFYETEKDCIYLTDKEAKLQSCGIEADVEQLTTLASLLDFLCALKDKKSGQHSESMTMEEVCERILRLEAFFDSLKDSRKSTSTYNSRSTPTSKLQALINRASQIRGCVLWWEGKIHYERFHRLKLETVPKALRRCHTMRYEFEFEPEDVELLEELIINDEKVYAEKFPKSN